MSYFFSATLRQDVSNFKDILQMQESSPTLFNVQIFNKSNIAGSQVNAT